MRRTTVKNKHVSCGLHYFWIILQKMVDMSSLSDCILMILYHKNWMPYKQILFSTRYVRPQGVHIIVCQLMKMIS